MTCHRSYATICGRRQASRYLKPLAEAAGENLQTLRHYERRGLLAELARSPGGHRLYPAEIVFVGWSTTWGFGVAAMPLRAGAR
ncbi:MerR family DNA-binding transcriptional regulator [Catellatospora sichuanensis]|uniref:MerR family DNA-binding transcriptional regulator n=1 Tax=Catellatospora sichuanensis TaxID=1969805 RepID=UPI001C91CC41|nr:MerR family DNA-binding transcriptional regulator [Catellatospora sichuanensis]